MWYHDAMREFFRGWRRKAGCVTLVMGLVVWSCWLRSLIASDFFLMNNGTTIITSGPNYLGLSRSPAASAAEWTAPTWFSVENGPPLAQSPDWTWQFCGFCYGYQLKGTAKTTTEHPDGRVVTEEVEYITHEHAWVIPYWSIAMPLTLLSAALILRKPRKQDRVTSEARSHQLKES
jgi:hypothetical protein